jgi:hypothetical protein
VLGRRGKGRTALPQVARQGIGQKGGFGEGEDLQGQAALKVIILFWATLIILSFVEASTPLVCCQAGHDEKPGPGGVTRGSKADTTRLRTPGHDTRPQANRFLPWKETEHCPHLEEGVCRGKAHKGTPSEDTRDLKIRVAR